MSSGGGSGDSLAGGAHGESGGGEVHVERVSRLKGSELLQLLLQPPILLRQLLAAPLQILAVNLRLLQLGPGNRWINKTQNL